MEVAACPLQAEQRVKVDVCEEYVVPDVLGKATRWGVLGYYWLDYT